MDRNVSFSIKPTDLEAQANFKKLKDHARSKGIHFSFYMCKAMEKMVKELKLK